MAIHKNLLFVQFKAILSDSLITGFGQIIENLPVMVLIYYMGNSNNTVWIDGLGMGLVWSNCFGLSLFLGLSAGLQTLSSHAIGSGNKQLAELLFQRCIAICLFMFLIIVIFFM